MRTSTRRKVDVLSIALVAIGLGLVGLFAALIGDSERIATHWTMAEVGADGTTRVTEVLDYDFGAEARHGIYRDVPDLEPDADIAVSSPTAPDQFTVGDLSGFETRIRIGDPNRTISGRHRYVIEYPLGTVVDGDEVSWNAVGDDWRVSISHSVIHLLTPYELTGVRCDKGSAGASGGCSATVVEPGHLVVDVGYLGAQEGITVTGTAGAALPTPVTPPEVPSGPPDDPGVGLVMVLVVTAAAAFAAGLVVSPFVRRAGREQVYAGGAADAAFGDASQAVRTVDHDELASMATIEFAPPEDLSATLGGVIHAEDTETHHRVAWLIEAAIREEIVLTGDGDDFVLTRGPATPNPQVASILDRMFAGRDRVELGSYDPSFAKGWASLETRLEEWRRSSDLWDPEGRRRRLWVRLLAGSAIVVGAVMVVGGGLVANRWGAPWLGLCALGGVIAGVGIGAAVRSWELLVRRPEGSALWIRIESFRRFIHDSEAYHATQAAEAGVLRQYTAWAVALDELDHWEDAVEAAAAELGPRAESFRHDVAFVAAAPAISRAVTSAGTKPSSSGGGGGGGVGGGGGGGGGGSW